MTAPVKRRLPRMTLQTGGCVLMLMAGALFVFGLWVVPV